MQTATDRGLRRRRMALLLAALAAPATASPLAPQAGSPVARISVEAPTASEFVLEATIPVPRGEVIPSPHTSSLAIVSGGQVVPTQVETVTRYAADADGADVVELIARVQRPAGSVPGDELLFDVVRDTQVRAHCEPTRAVSALLNQPDGLLLTARDLHGNMYTAGLLDRVQDRDPSVEAMRTGRLILETRSHEVMLPTSTAQAGALAPYPHLLGVHVFPRVYADEDFMVLDLVFHNGMAGRDVSPADDPIHDIYFNQLDLHLPTGWSLGWAIDNPMVGAPVPNGSGTRVSLVEALPQGKHHYVPQQAQFVRRLVVAHGQAALERGMEVIERRTRGFCVPGPRPDAASNNPTEDLWSWWNEGTGRYLTTNNRLPHLDHIPRTTLRDQIALEDTQFRQQTASGDDGTYPTPFPNLGWAQPWGIQYGGMTGGDEIEMYPTLDVAWARSSVGLRFLDLKSKAYIDRQPVALYELDGHPPTLEDHLVGSGDDRHLPTFFYLQPSGSGDYFGLEGADQRFAENAYLTGRMPPYKKDIEDFLPIDLQHYTRFLNPLMGLTWLANDSVAKLELELSAALFRLTFHEYRSSGQGHIQGTTLRRRIEDVNTNPGQGAAFGRGEAWGIIASAAYYATAAPAERAALAPWFRRIVEVARAGQSTCTGNPTAIHIQKHFKGAYQSRQSFEVGFFLNAIDGIRTTVLDNADPAASGLALDLIANGARSTIHAPFWNDTLGGQVRLMAVRPVPNDLPEFCVSIPENGYAPSPYVDHTTALPAWAATYRATGDATFLQRAAAAMAGGGNLEAALEALGTSALDDFAPILSAIQEL